MWLPFREPKHLWLHWYPERIWFIIQLLKSPILVSQPFDQELTHLYLICTKHDKNSANGIPENMTKYFTGHKENSKTDCYIKMSGYNLEQVYKVMT